MAKYGMLAKLYFEEMAEDFIRVEYHTFEENTFCSGAAFVSKHEGQEEDDGWLVCYLHNEETDISQVRRYI